MLGEVLQVVGYLGAVAGGEVEVVDLIDAYQVVRASVITPQTASVMSVVFAPPDREAEEPGELHGQLPRGRGGRDGDVDDRDPVAAAGVAPAVDRSWVRPSWLIAVVLPVPAAPETIRPRRALISVPVQQGQPPARRATSCRSVEVATTTSSRCGSPSRASS